MSIKILKPGLLSSIQDLGRYGYQRYGVIVSGAMDHFALRIANILVGNDENEAALEITILGPTLQFEQATMIAICGGDFNAEINGQAIPLWRQISLQRNAILSLSNCSNGCRAYVAVAGGFDIEPVMNSRSTYLRAEIGGFHGRMLQQGDCLPLRGSESALDQKVAADNTLQKFNIASWQAGGALMPSYCAAPTVRVVLDQGSELFTEQSMAEFLDQSYKITTNADRMAYRLSGHALSLKLSTELLTTAVTFGTIQVTHEGQPIILLADRQTCGGYPKIANVATVDLPLLAQLKPGDQVSFTAISLAQAQDLYIAREKAIELIKQGIKLRRWQC